MSAPHSILECMFESATVASPIPDHVGPGDEAGRGPVLTVEDEADFAAEFEMLCQRYSDEPAEPSPCLDGLPGPELAALLSTVDLAAMDEFDVVESISAWARIGSWAAAKQAESIAELARRRNTDPPGVTSSRWCRFVADEVASALTISRRAADVQVGLALELQRLPGTVAALRTGRIDLAKARAICDSTCVVDDEQARAVEDAVLPKASEQTPPRLREALTRAVAEVDPEAAEKRHKKAVKDRKVEFWPLHDGIAELRAIGPADDVTALFTAVDALARKAKTDGDTRGIDARRFDALADLAHLVLADGDLPTTRRARPHLNVTMSLPTLLGLDDAPGVLAGYGPIPASMARRLASDATWRRLLTDPATGALRDYGRTTYRPPADLADFVLVRDRTCRFPGCRQPAHRCELDHTVPYPLGGTCEHNIGPLCKHHHRLKHETGWTVDQRPGAVFEWTSPAGHRYLVEPEPLHPPGTDRLREPGFRVWPTEPPEPPDPRFDDY
jgi:hypothetical protein